MIKIDVRADIKKVQMFLRATEQGAKRATARALNKTATTVRNTAAGLLQEKRNLRIGEIKKQMRIERANVRKLAATVTVSGRPISIRHFASAGKRGVTVRVEKGGKRTRLARYGNRAFVNAAWRPGVFVRKTRKRLPIEAWPPVPGLPKVLVQERIVDALKAEVARTFPKRFKEEMNYEINVAKGRAR
jgi:hypothetical protein